MTSLADIHNEARVAVIDTSDFITALWEEAFKYGYICGRINTTTEPKVVPGTTYKMPDKKCGSSATASPY